MPHESASCEAGLGTSSRKCFRTLIYFSWSISFQTDEYSSQLHLEVCERNTPSHPEGQRFKSPWWQTQKVFSVAKEDFKCFISIKYLNLSQISWKKEMMVGALSETTRTWSMYLQHTRLHPFHYTTPTYTHTEMFKLQDLLFCFKEGK